ncbi:MAG: hypothetical protein A2X93_02335 [Deltaproteobacteria bacterium GWC2_56_8]|nr:MAG: hypothetical protein A2X99_03395 [Deltaproteobacteria bacterium GWB2_55_19]OGP32236.1 MAG: hypothetical protein A2X93_02335 [Deltaproteobacteria bacterium GWC2_56_8]
MKPVIILIIVFFAVRLLKKSLQKKTASMSASEQAAGGARIPNKGAEKRGEEMVLDPVCGSYVPESSALSAKRGGETAHFCSPDCRDKFLNG